MYWRLLRPPTLTASVAPVLVGLGLALSEHTWRPAVFIAMLLASMLLQGATNMLNEYFDFTRGLDSADMVGIAGTIVRDRVQPKTVLRFAQLTIAAALVLGIFICASTSWWVAIAGLVCMSFMYLYSSGPKPISSTPFGEVTAGSVMGPGIILITYFTQTGRLTWVAIAASLPVGILIGCILLANNIRDIEHDRPGGRRTVPIVCGRAVAIRILGAAFASAFVIVGALIALGALSPWVWLSWAAVPLWLPLPRRFQRTRAPAQLQRIFADVSKTLLVFSTLYFIGLLIGAWT